MENNGPMLSSKTKKDLSELLERDEVSWQGKHNG